MSTIPAARTVPGTAGAASARSAQTYFRALVLAALGVAIVLPIALILARSVTPAGTFDFAAPFRALGERSLNRIFLNSIVLGFLVVIGAAVAAVPLALVVTRTSMRRHAWIDVVLIVPFMTPPYINAMGWIIFMQPRGYLMQLLPGIPDPSGVFFSLFGMVTIMSFNLFPFLYLMLKNALVQVSGSLDEAAAVHGARRWYRFRRVTVRLLVSSFAMGALLVFVKTLSEFGTPITMGRRIGFNVLTSEIYRYTSSWPLDFSRAATFSTLLLSACLIAWYAQSVIANRNSFHLVAGKGSREAVLRRGSWLTVVGWAFFGVLLTLSIGVPYFSIFATSLLKIRGRGLALGNFTWEHYRAIISPGSPGMAALRWSLILSVIAAAVAAVIGTVCALAVQSGLKRSEGRAQPVRKAIDFIALLPNTVPSIVVIVGLILMWNSRAMPIRAYNTPAMLVIAYVVLFLPFTVQYVKSSYGRIHPNVIAAGRVCGAGPAYTFRRITLPLILPGIFAGWTMTFAISFRELVGSLIIRPPSVHTTATFIYAQFEQGSVPQGMAMAAISVGLTTAIVVLVQRFTSVKRGPG